MPFIRNLWVATLTSTLPDSGPESELVVIMHQGGFDVVHRDLGFGDVTSPAERMRECREDEGDPDSRQSGYCYSPIIPRFRTEIARD